jgi:hypothetical protein
MNSTSVVRYIGKTPVHCTEFIELSRLVPKSWIFWFYNTISDNAPFSWGDNNRTLINANFFYTHCENRIMDLSESESTTYGAKREWLKKISNLGQMYIDLEN